jgi:protein-tyrosine phosphatase
MPFEIIFVCTGNTCRSPMAEALMRAALPHDKREKYLISSAGTNAIDDRPPSILASEAMNELGLDIDGHKSRALTSVMIDKADLILALSEGHLQSIHATFPGAAGKTFLLTEYSGLDKNTAGIQDPYGGDIDTYRSTRDEISRHITRIASKM